MAEFFSHLSNKEIKEIVDVCARKANKIILEGLGGCCYKGQIVVVEWVQGSKVSTVP